MRSKDDFRRANRLRRLNAGLQFLLCLSLLGAVNYLGSRYFERRDLTEEREFSLAPETEAYLSTVEKPVRIFVVFPEIETDETSRRVLRDLKKLLSNFELYSRTEGNGNISAEFIDVFRQRNRAREILGRHDISSQSSILVTSGDRMKQISMDALYDFEDGKMRAFRGEAEFLSAILQVTREADRKVYFLAGQGEFSLESVDPLDGLSRLRSFLRERGFALETIDLTNFARVPEDAGAVVTVAPATSFRKREVNLLREYLRENNGSFLALLEPGEETGLEGLAREWGIRIDDRIVIDVGPDFQSATGDLIIREFTDHPIGDFIRNLGVTVLFGLPRPILPDPEAARDPDTLQVDSLLLTSAESWAESDLRPGAPVSYDAEEDREGPVPIGAASKRQADTAFDFALAATQGGRIVVLGNADFVTNSRLNAFGNRLLFLSALNWGLDVGNEVNVAPKEVRSYLIVLSQAELRNLLFYLLVPAALMAAIGFLVALVRR